jgi:hypothetical protein
MPEFGVNQVCFFFFRREEEGGRIARANLLLEGMICQRMFDHFLGSQGDHRQDEGGRREKAEEGGKKEGRAGGRRKVGGKN